MKQLPQKYYELLEELQAVDFVILELALYLDTHPNDHDAIQQYNAYVQMRKTLKKQFEQEFGSLTSFGSSYSKYPWDWEEAPWPWQV
ncbi:spore coat protein CotJB [Bacillus sp. FJAT-49732]|uniref:Spore coat protein CotJB n=1 Tax=Lederbergia citrisecunda TaxID=2833583 RepID=A0A942TK22_9BACI|nr:spore coat protein CotJB [Lederbergia citrisecunda]MBS4199530.1 spore coat protein CotJB [Lederbergia citrisecunda]